MAEQEDVDLGGLEAPVDLDDDDIEDLDDLGEGDLVDDDPLGDDPLVDDPLVDDPLVDDPLADDALNAPLVGDALNVAVPLAPETVDGTGEPKAVAVSTDDDDEDDDDDDLDPDDVEAGLDVILKDRLVVVDEEPDEDEEVPDPEERVDGSTRVPTKRPEEFVCASCFLVKHPSQLADPTRMFCRDCV